MGQLLSIEWSISRVILLARDLVLLLGWKMGSCDAVGANTLIGLGGERFFLLVGCVEIDEEEEARNLSC